ncbi:putative membrane channel-forming protein YqfA (hemolysin III family) [Chryseobacterium ginsenosidimutans]|uniref:APC family permease n=1 Tax=Chryseobacterium ginsenosidimutans TaxID=687846 RepID=UPI00278AC87D|nr:APC family permease [Chryseobacterium ginsenosidimutans]MDQ0595517.1 putative membrane channel-forming protein YqfA (hemolysin III family) [Chryseobacterium ginsenosidimutans]
MELRIKPFPKNNYPKKGLLIKGSSPLIWLNEIEILGIDLNQIQSFPIPSNEPNVLYGCFLIFQNNVPTEIGRNSCFQCVDGKFFIPENTTFYPKINPEEWQNIDSEFLIMHPGFGLVKLNEEIDWTSLIQNPKQSEDKIRKPSNGIKIPQQIESYTVEMDDEKVLEALQKPQTEEEWMKDLPFDLKKVMAGNKKEIEKYLSYIEKYPDRAVDLGVPLDVMGTSRGDGFGKFKFLENTWFGKLFGSNSGDRSNSTYSQKYRWIFWVFLIVIGLVRLFIFLNKEKHVENAPMASSGKISDVDKNRMNPVVAYKSGVTDIDMKIDSMYGRKRRELMEEYMIANLMHHDYKKENAYEKYLKNGGRPIEKISKEADVIENKVTTSTDSLKRVYHKKIVKYLAQNEEKYKKKIADSLNKISSGKPADQGIVKTLLKKKQVLIEDSLGRLYGTKEYIEPPIDPNKAKKMETFENEKPYSKHNISFSEIIWLIIFMTGIVGLYSFVVKRKSLNIGGDNVPNGIKIFLIIILVVMLAYIFYPLIEMFGYNWFVWILIIGVVLLLYRLFSEDKTILKSDKDE